MKFFSTKQGGQQFERWVSDFHEPLYRHALWMTGNGDVAADMVQEAYYQAWSVRDSLKDPDRVLPWLLTILRRQVYRDYKCRYRHQETLEELGRQVDEDAHNEDPTGLLEIYRAMEALSVQHREVFLMFYLHGFSYEEISDQLDIPKGTVMSRLARAREALSQVTRVPETGKVINLQDRVRDVADD